MRIVRWLFPALFVIACNDNDDSKTFSSKFSPKPLPGFETAEVIYNWQHDPQNDKIAPLEDDVYQLLNQGKYWKNGSIVVPKEGQIEISGVNLWRSFDKPDFSQITISVYINNSLEKEISRNIGNYERVDNIYRLKVGFEGETLNVKQGDVITIKNLKAKELTGMFSLRDLIIRFKPKD